MSFSSNELTRSSREPVTDSAAAAASAGSSLACDPGRGAADDVLEAADEPDLRRAAEADR